MAGQWQQSSHENYFSESSQGHTQELNNQKKGDERSEYALVSNILGWEPRGPLLLEKQEGSALCRHPHTPALVRIRISTIFEFNDVMNIIKHDCSKNPNGHIRDGYAI